MPPLTDADVQRIAVAVCDEQDRREADPELCRARAEAHLERLRKNIRDLWRREPRRFDQPTEGA